ncbi:MAG: hypothetical protein ACI9HK_004727 [Pirellulaceae bacterium]|jgi:hypothetical protein
MSDRNYPSPRTSDLRDLAERHGPVISLYVPVTAAVPDAAQNSVRHERVVSEALARWRELGAAEDDVEKAAHALKRFSSEAALPAATVKSRAAFWSSDQGLRVFGLPFRCDESARVASCARLRPIAFEAARPHSYRVLTFSANQVALFEGDEDELRRMPAPDLPENLEAALGKQLSEPSVHTHSTGRAGSQPVYHGQGGAPRARQVDTEKLYKHVARGLEASLPDDGLPLILAADAQHRSGLKKALGGGISLVEDLAKGNADHTSLSDLHQATWSILVGSHEASHAGDNRGQPPVTQISEIVAEATMGRIRLLRAPEMREIPARLDRNDARAKEAWGDDDLIDDLVVEILRRGGSIEVVEDQSFSATDCGLSAELR